mmetsp:Transcript_5568/g.11043  ORF Transcript_5568/g.11043 Transcript_5568/m.11043 type:complete len:216 (+) Transcript_5568:266-913(+)
MCWAMISMIATRQVGRFRAWGAPPAVTNSLCCSSPSEPEVRDLFLQRFNLTLGRREGRLLPGQLLIAMCVHGGGLSIAGGTPRRERACANAARTAVTDRFPKPVKLPLVVVNHTCSVPHHLVREANHLLGLGRFVVDVTVRVAAATPFPGRGVARLARAGRCRPLLLVAIVGIRCLVGVHDAHQRAPKNVDGAGSLVFLELVQASVQLIIRYKSK